MYKAKEGNHRSLVLKKITWQVDDKDLDFKPLNEATIGKHLPEHQNVVSVFDFIELEKNCLACNGVL